MEVSTVYHEPVTATVTPRPRRSRRHARIYYSMLRLPAAHQGVLNLLRYILKDGESSAISNAYIARRTGYSEGYVSVIVRQLAGDAIAMKKPRDGQAITALCPVPFIARTLTDGGAVITMLPPPEERADAGVPADGDQPVDPTPECTFAPPPSAPAARGGDQPVDPLIHRDSCMQGEGARAQPPTATPVPEPAPDVLTGTIYEVCKISPAMATPKQRGQAQQLAALLASVRATPDDVRRAARWFRQHDWRGRKGEVPTPAMLREVWGQVPKPEITPLAQPRSTMPDTTPTIDRTHLRALMEAARARGKRGTACQPNA